MNQSFSIVIPCYSEGFLLLEAVDSALKQSYPPLEIILVNDASQDPTTIEACHTAANLSDQIKVVWRKENGGPAMAINEGFSQASGDIFLNLDADDILPTDALENVVQIFSKHPEIDWVYGNYIRQDHPNKPAKVIDPRPIDLADMLSSKQCWPSSRWTLRATNPVRRQVWQALNGHDSNLGANDLHDLEFMIRLLNAPYRSFYTSHKLYVWRKYLGKNTKKVTPLSWYKIAQKHRLIYKDNNLEYRALELLVLGSKWLQKLSDTKRYQKELFAHIIRGKFKFITLIIMFIPPSLFRLFAGLANRLR
jgi:glycosyltransferase involved in cell wall biosynthesis